MMSSPSISIITPVYNVEKFLPECIESILSQTYKEFELILVDDGSKDSSGFICDEYARRDSRIRVIHQQNTGVSKARNVGLAIAKGEWITFVDSDDWVDESFLENFEVQDASELSIQGLRYVKYPELKTINERCFDSRKESFHTTNHFIEKSDLLDYGTVCCKAYRRDIILWNNIRFDNRISYHEDHIFYFQYLKNIHSVSLHSHTYYNYRITGSKSSLSSKRHNWKELNASSDALRNELQLMPFWTGLDKAYQEKVKSYCLNPKVSATYQLHSTNETFRNRCQILQTIWYSEYSAINDYKPNEVRGKILRLCLKCGVPLTIIYLSLLHCVHNLNKAWK